MNTEYCNRMLYKFSWRTIPWNLHD